MSNATSRRVDALLAKGLPLGQAIAQAVQGIPQGTGRVTSVETIPGVFAIAQGR